MLQVTNQSPFAAATFVMPDAQGVDTAYVVVKATFSVGPDGVRVAERQEPFVPGDRYLGQAGASSLAHAGEAHTGKPATDVILVGEACAPGGRPAPSFGVSLSVGALRKVIQVHGDRVWVAGAFDAAPSSPRPVARVPLVHERAFGGRHDLGPERFLADLRNPVGVGFRGKRALAEMDGTPVPNLEDPRHPIRTLTDQPAPAAPGFVAPAWLPRRTFAGTYDDAWRQERAPYLPADFDPRFFQCAPPDQVYQGVLQGGEPVEVVNASPSGLLRFKLPRVRLAAVVWVAGLAERPALRLETLLLRPGEDAFSILWRGAVQCDKQALRVDEVAVSVQSMEGLAA